MTEAEFQAQIVQLATMLGWRHLHCRRSIGKGRQWVTATNIVGWPDLLCWKRGQVIAVELKSDKGTLTPEQREVLASLAEAGVAVYVWRPSDFDEAQRVLSRKVAA
jgi:hypothetical protein